MCSDSVDLLGKGQKLPGKDRSHREAFGPAGRSFDAKGALEQGASDANLEGPQEKLGLENLRAAAEGGFLRAEGVAD